MLYEGIIVSDYDSDTDAEIVYGGAYVFADNEEDAKTRLLLDAASKMDEDVDPKTLTVLIRPFI